MRKYIIDRKLIAYIEEGLDSMGVLSGGLHDAVSNGI